MCRSLRLLHKRCDINTTAGKKQHQWKIVENIHITYAFNVLSECFRIFNTTKTTKLYIDTANHAVFSSHLLNGWCSTGRNEIHNSKIGDKKYTSSLQWKMHGKRFSSNLMKRPWGRKQNVWNNNCVFCIARAQCKVGVENSIGHRQIWFRREKKCPLKELKDIFFVGYNIFNI